MLDDQDVVSCDDDVLHGTPVFTGTRVPVTTLFDYLLGGSSFDEFYEDFPTVTRAHVAGIMYEIAAGVGYILRLMIDHTHQGQGYGRAATIEMIRRLRLSPEVEVIGIGHRRDNVVAAHLYQSLDFLPWEPTWAAPDSPDVYLKWPD